MLLVAYVPILIAEAFSTYMQLDSYIEKKKQVSLHCIA